MHEFLLLLFGLLFWHALADYPLQGDFLAKAKVPDAIPGVPWFWPMSAHAAIHAGGVWLITGSGWLGLAEFVAHGAIDLAKGLRNIDFTTDQLLHIQCKLLWAGIAAWGLA